MPKNRRRVPDTSTTAKGNAFRDEVAGLLSAAGFNAVTETRSGFKKIDVRGRWEKWLFGQRLTIAVEAKDYDKALPLSECTSFVTHYGTLVREGLVDRAWLVSRGPLTPDGRLLIETSQPAGLACYTFEELQRAIFNVD